MRIAILALIALVGVSLFSANKPASSQGFNVASVYPVADENAKDGDIVISAEGKGIVLSGSAYDSRIFGVIDENPVVVLREASPTARMFPIVRQGDVAVNINDYNGEIKVGDFITTSPQAGIGMKAGQSGYVIGLALNDAQYGNETISVDNKQVKSGTVNIAIRVEYAELTTARNANRLLLNLNQALFKNVQDPEKFTVIIRYLLAGLIALASFAVGFFAITRSVSRAIEALGRNPLGRSTILLSLGLQVVVTVVGALATIVVVFFLLKL